MKELKGFDAMCALNDLPDDIIVDACPSSSAAVSPAPRRPQPRAGRVRRVVLMCALLALCATLLIVVMPGQDRADGRDPILDATTEDDPEGEGSVFGCENDNTTTGQEQEYETDKAGDGNRLPAGLETWFDGKEILGDRDPSCNFDPSDGEPVTNESMAETETDEAFPPVDGGMEYESSPSPDYSSPDTENAVNAALVPKPEVSVVALSGNRYVRAYQYGRWLLDGTTPTNHTRTDSVLDRLQNGMVGNLSIPVLTSMDGNVYILRDENFTLNRYRVFDKRGNAATPNAPGTYFVILEMSYVAANGLRCGGEYAFWLELIHSSHSLNMVDATTIPEHLIKEPTIGSEDETTSVWESETVIEWASETEIAWETETEPYPTIGAATEHTLVASNLNDDNFILPQSVNEVLIYQEALAFYEKKLPLMIRRGHCDEAPVLAISNGNLNLSLPTGTDIVQDQFIVYNAAGEACDADQPDGYYVAVLIKRNNAYECFVFRLKITKYIEHLLVNVFEGDNRMFGREFEYLVPVTNTATPGEGTDYDEKESIDEPLPDVDA